MYSKERIIFTKYHNIIDNINLSGFSHLPSEVSDCSLLK